MAATGIIACSTGSSALNQALAAAGSAGSSGTTPGPTGSSGRLLHDPYPTRTAFCAVCR